MHSSGLYHVFKWTLHVDKHLIICQVKYITGNICCEAFKGTCLVTSIQVAS